MDPVMAVLDIGVIVRDIAIATQRRLEAAQRLPETVARVKRTLGQVIGATEDVQLDKPTENALGTIKLKLGEVNTCLDRLDRQRPAWNDRGQGLFFVQIAPGIHQKSILSFLVGSGSRPSPSPSPSPRPEEFRTRGAP